MVRRGPASVYRRKSRSKSFSRIALTGPALRRACRMMIRRFGQSVGRSWFVIPSARFSRCGTDLFRVAWTALKVFRGWRCGVREWPVDLGEQTSCDAIVTVAVTFFAGGSVVMQAIDQTNPASSRAIAVTATCLGLPFAIMRR